MTILFLKHRRYFLSREEETPELSPSPGEPLPSVTVQLPIFNEALVVERLIDAVVRLDYPAHLLQIQVLDDFTDETTELIQARVKQCRQQRVNMQSFQRILLVIDGKTNRKALFERAIALSTGNQACLKVVNVIKQVPPEVRELNISGSRGGLLANIYKGRRRRLEQLVSPLRREGIQVSTDVLFGAPFLEITREVLHHEHDLVLMTAAGNAPGKRLFGRTAMPLLRACPCSIWFMKPDQPAKYTRILAAVDPNPSNEERHMLNFEIMDLATSLAHREQSELHIVHTWSLFRDSVSKRSQIKRSDKAVDKIVQEIRDEHEGWLDDLLQRYRLASLAHQTYLLEGRAEILIPKLVKERGIELLVMGAISRTGRPGVMIGNIAEKILQRVDCSVLVIKPERRDSPVTLNNSRESSY